MSQWSKRSRGRMELAAGDPVAAERALRESWDVLTQMGLQSSLGETAVPLAEALLRAGPLRRGRLDAEGAQGGVGERRRGSQRSSARRAGEAARGGGWTRLAEETADRALRVVRPMDWLCLQVDALLAHADVMQSAGRQPDALASTEEALRIAEAKGYEAAAITARRSGRSRL